MVFKKIAHAEQNLENKINDNFNEVINGTGLIPVNFFAPAVGNLSYIVVNGVLYFNGSFRAGATGNVKITTMPKQFGTKSFIAKNLTTREPVSMDIETDSSFTINSNKADDSISLDGVAIRVGNIDLGGKTDRLLNHVRQAFSYFHKEMEVA